MVQLQDSLARSVRTAAISALLMATGLCAAQTPLETRSPDGSPAEFTFREPFTAFVAGRGSGFGLRSIGSKFVFPGSVPEADGHSCAVYTTDGSRIIVANRDSRNLTIFDANTRALVQEVPINGTPQGVAVSSDGVHAVTANHREDTATVVNLTTGATVDVDIGAAPTTVRITPDGATAVVNCASSQELWVIDIATATVLRTIAGGTIQAILSVNPETAATGFRTSSHEIASNTKLVYPDTYNNRVLIIDIATGTVTPIITANQPLGVAIVPGGATAVVTHYGATRKVSVIDVNAATITKTISVTSDLQGPVAVDPAGTRAVVAVLNNSRVVDLVTNTVSGDIATASVNEMYTTSDGLYALCVGYNGSLISFSTQTLVKNLNQFVSTSIGAVSPVAPRAAMFSDTFGEDMVIVSTAGAAGSLLSAAPTGPAPEADSARTAAVTPDGTRAICVSQRSQTATIVDTRSGAVLHTINVDRRPGTVKITPNGAKAVVASRDGTQASIIDMSTGTVSNVAISTRADAIEISPDSQFAYLGVVTADGVWRINLNTNSVQGAKLTSGNMGGVGYSYQQFSGMALSPDGATLVTCNSFDNNITIINTASWGVVKTLAVGTFPTRAVFSGDNSKIYIANRDGNSVSVVNNAGAASTVAATWLVGSQPFDLAVSPDATRLYVANYGSNTVTWVNTATGTTTNTFTLPATHSISGLALGNGGNSLAVATGTASLTLASGYFTTSQAGRTTVIDTTSAAIAKTFDTGRAPSAIGASASPLAITPEPWGDGMSVITLGCPTDYDLSGFVDFDDFNQFVVAFELGDLSADFDGSGFVDFDDFNQYVVAFEAGC